jgi:hypothetical protein
VLLNRVEYTWPFVNRVPSKREKMAIEGANIFSSQGSKVSTAIGKPTSMVRRVYDVWEGAGLDARLPLCSRGCVPPLCIDFVASMQDASLTASVTTV